MSDKAKEIIQAALKEIQRLGYEDCISCVHGGCCIYADECKYRWRYADDAERMLKDEES